MSYTDDQLVIFYEDCIVSFLETKLASYGLRITKDVTIGVLASSLGGRNTLIVNWMKAGDQNTTRTGGSTGFTTFRNDFAIRVVLTMGRDSENADKIKTLLGALKRHLTSRAFKTESGITAGAIRMYRVPNCLWWQDTKEGSLEGLLHFEVTIDESIIDYGGD